MNILKVAAIAGILGFSVPAYSQPSNGWYDQYNNWHPSERYVEDYGWYDVYNQWHYGDCINHYCTRHDGTGHHTPEQQGVLPQPADPPIIIERQGDRFRIYR